MKRTSLYATVPALVMTATAGLQAGAAHAAATSHTYKGAVAEQDRWGPIQVTITVKNKKITNVKATVSPDNPRSSFIESQALPILKEEVLKAQSGNIDAVSGATDTSYGYIQSLQGAIAKARRAKALK